MTITISIAPLPKNIAYTQPDTRCSFHATTETAPNMGCTMFMQRDVHYANISG